MVVPIFRGGSTHPLPGFGNRDPGRVSLVKAPSRGKRREIDLRETCRPVLGSPLEALFRGVLWVNAGYEGG